MPTPSERNALLFFASVALLGAGVRAVRATQQSHPADGATSPALERQIAAVDSVRSTPRKPARTRRQKPEPPRALDLDRAPADSLERLPRIGPALAARIVADRDSNGPFGSLDELQRVKGIGPAMAKELAPYVTFSGTPRPSRVGARLSTPRRTPQGTARSPRASP